MRTGHEQGQHFCDWRVHYTQESSETKACRNCKRDAECTCIPHLCVSVVVMHTFALTQQRKHIANEAVYYAARARRVYTLVYYSSSHTVHAYCRDGAGRSLPHHHMSARTCQRYGDTHT